MLLMPLGAWAQSEYGLTIAGIPVTSQNAGGITGDNITGIVTYNADQHALTLEGATIAGSIEVTNENNLTINVIGANSISSGTSSALKSKAGGIPGPTITFVKAGDGDCSLELSSTGVTVISTQFGGLNYTNLALVTDVEGDVSYDYQFSGLSYYDSQSQSTLPVTSATITSYTTYDLIISGEQVTSLNMNAICKNQGANSSISFDGEHTLTLNNVPNVVFAGGNEIAGFIQTSMDLTINLVGYSDFDCGQSVFITRLPGDNDNHTVTFTTDATNPGMLTLQVGDQFDGFEMAFENNLSWMPAGYYDTTDPNGPVAWVAIPFTEYGITVGGVAVTSANASDIRGDGFDAYKVSYSPATKTLSLENAFFEGGVSTNDDLTISAIGSNTIYGDVTSSKNGGATLTIRKGETDEGVTLNLSPSSSDPTGFSSVVYDNMYLSNENDRDVVFSPTRQRFEKNEWQTTEVVSFTSDVTYDLWLGGTKVTEENKDNVLGTVDAEPTVTFNPEGNILTLNNMSLSSTSIYDSGIISRLSALTIVVNGDNTITNNDSCTAIRADAPMAQTLTIQRGSADNCSLAFNSYRPIRNFNTLTLNGIHWEWGTNYTYGASNFGDGNGYGLMDASGAEAENVVLNDEALNPPSMFMEGMELGFEYESNSKIFYAIDYVDSSLDDIEETELNVQEPYVTLEGPCTVTAYAQNDDFRSVTITGKLFGFVESEVSGVPGTEIDIPAIVPAIEPTDGIEFGCEGSVTPNDNYTKIDLTDVPFGNYYLQLYPSSEQSPYTILNAYLQLSVNVIPPAPTISDAIVEGDVIEITTDVQGDGETTMSSIYYSWDAEDNTGTLYTETAQTGAQPEVQPEAQPGAQPTAQNGTLYAWVVYQYYDEESLSYKEVRSEKAQKEFTVARLLGISVNGIAINENNRTNVLGDQGADPTVQFDGKNTLFLNNANLNGEIIVNSSAFVDEPLTISLKGTNTINNRTYLVQNALASANIKVKFSTGELAPGSLTYTTPEILKEPISAFVGCNVLYLNGLAPTLSEGANSGSVLSISMSLKPIVNHSGEEKTLDGNSDGLGKDIETKTTEELTAGVVENGILYTLPDADDGYESPEESGSGKVVAINSTMTEEEINTIAGQVADGTLVPSTSEFAAKFKGITFLLPAGAGNMKFDVRTNESGVLAVKIGEQSAVTFEKAKTAFEELVVPFACSVPTYVLLCHDGGGTDSREMDSRRAPGRKETATVEIKGLSVSASSVVAVPEPALSPVMLDKSAVAKEAGKHFIKVVNADVAGVDADAFEGVKTDDELTYVDLTKTGIKGITVDRSTDAFKNVPEKAFIYLPAGNKVKTGTKNVIIGSVCEDMEMADDAPYFEMAQDFTARNVKQNRDYSDFVGKNCTVYLPFAIDEETAASLGTFYELKGYDGTTVSMESVTETKANTPYMFKPKAADTKVAAKMVTVEATPAAAPVAGNMKFVGTYEQKDIVSNTSTQYYCFMADGAEAGKFVRVVTTPVTMNPYRAYMVVEGADARELDLVIDGVSTGIKNMKVGTDDNVYYDLQGRRVLYPTKGLYIVNGRKVIIK